MISLKKAFILASLVGGFLYLCTLAYYFGVFEEGEAATITTGYTFSAGETNVTHTKLNQAVNSATISGIATADINDGAITGPKVAASTIPGSKIQTNTLTGGTTGNLALNTVADTNMVVHTLTPISVTTNWVARQGSAMRYTNSNVTLEYSNDQIASSAVRGTNTSTGSAMAGLVPKLNAAHGKLDTSLYYAPNTNATTLAAASTGQATYTTLATVTTTATNGAVFLAAIGTFDDQGTGAGSVGIRITDNTGATLGAGAHGVGTDIQTVSIPCFAIDQLNGAAKTYTLSGIIQGTPESNAQWVMSGSARADADIVLTNATRIVAIQFPTQ